MNVDEDTLLNVETVLYLSPHFDDLAYSNGGLITKKTMSAKFTLVNIFTRSVWAPNLKSHGISEERISEVRQIEDSRFCRKIGIRSLSLGFPDSSCRGYSNSNEAPLLINEEIIRKDSILNKVRTAIAEVLHRSRFDLVFAPLAIGNHVDHYCVFNTVHEMNLEGTQKVYYEDLPYCALLCMNEIDHVVSQRLQDAHPIVIDISNEIAKKIDNIRIYSSQVSANDIDAVRFHSRRIMGSEHLFHERIWVQVYGK